MFYVYRRHVVLRWARQLARHICHSSCFSCNACQSGAASAVEMMLALNTQPFHAPGLCPLALFGLAKLRCCLRPSLMEIYAVDAILWREAVGSRCVSAPEYAIAGLHRELAVERMEKDVLKKL